MSKENKKTCVRRGKCQCSRTDNQTTSSVQESTKSVVKNSDCNLQEAPTKENMIMPLTKGLCSLKDAIIENGIKYILHLLYFYLFDTIFSIFLGSEEHIETKHAEPCNKNHEKQNKWRQINQKSTRQKMENENSNGRALEKLQNVVKDSDTSRNQSRNATNVTAINMPLNYDTINNSISHAALKEPTDISTEKHNFNKTQFPINISQDTESFTDEQSNVTRDKFSKSYTKKQCNNSSVNKEIPRMEFFKEKFTSSDSSSSFPKSFASYKYKKSKRTNFFYNKENRKSSDDSLIKSRLKKNETEQKKKLSIKFSPTNEKKRFTFDKEKSEKQTEQRYKKETEEKKNSSRKCGPTKYKSHYSRIPGGHEESKENNRKYKETGTQTDIAFPTDCDVEMVSMGTKRPEKQLYSYTTRKSQDRDMNQKLNYIADNKRSKNRLLANAYRQISSHSTSSSSIDLSSDARTSTTPDTDLVAGLWPENLFYSINTSKTPIRAPPGFPKIPQNPPLTSYICNPGHSMLPSLRDDYDLNSLYKLMTIVPSAPSPMRHLYYDYPEFMELPTSSNSSNILY